MPNSTFYPFLQMLLYRPVGLKELELIYDSGFREFPPRLPEQPIFYPVLNFDYAVQIARDWNTKSSDFAGYVTKFEVEDSYAQQFKPQIVGGSRHRELWIPAEDLPNVNAHIIGRITVETAFFGEPYTGFVPDRFGMSGKTADEQLLALALSLEYSGFDLYSEVLANHKAVYLNYLYWKQKDFSPRDLRGISKQRVLDAISKVCAMGEQRYPLPGRAAK